jgi:hypothetical protein
LGRESRKRENRVENREARVIMEQVERSFGLRVKNVEKRDDKERPDNGKFSMTILHSLLSTLFKSVL